jgi:transcription initiation factor TFIIB
MFVEKFKLSRNVRKNAIFSFRKVIPKNELRARKIQLIALVLVDYWAKQDNNPIQMDVIQKEFSYSQHIFMDYKQLIYRLLHFTLCPVNPGQYVIKICESLQVNYEVLSCGKKIVDFVASRENLSGCDPKGFAAGSIYFACCIKGQRRSQMDVSTAAGVSDITLRSRLKIIQKYTRHFSSF